MRREQVRIYHAHMGSWCDPVEDFVVSSLSIFLFLSRNTTTFLLLSLTSSTHTTGLII